MTGRSLPHAILMMIPEPWAGHETMSAELKAFYEYHSSLMEPWDGPASIAFTDGSVIGAVLDRNGLRPSRYYVTKDDLVIMASEVGVLDIPPENILIKERLHPGRIFLVDTAQGRIVSDDEIKKDLARAQPYAEWLKGNLVDIEDLPAAPYLPPPSHETVLRRQQTFGYTHEDLRLLLAPMAARGEEAIGSMGTDTALAVLSDRPRLLYDYFKQLFAQVTNPPARRDPRGAGDVDGIDDRPEGNLLDPRPESCRQIKIKYPVIDNDQLAKLRHVYDPGSDRSRCRCCSTRAATAEPRTGDDASEGPRQRGGGRRLHHPDPVGPRRRSRPRADPEPARDGRRAPPSRPRGHAHALRAGRRIGRRARGASLRAAPRLRRRRGQPVSGVRDAGRHDPAGHPVGVTHEQAVKNYIKALNKGILKVMSKMGISTLQSYCGAQIFEAVGLNRPFVDKYFTWTASRIGGVGIDVIAEEVLERHRRAFQNQAGALRSSSRAASISGAATASTTCSIRTRSSSCSTRRRTASTPSSRNTRSSSTIRAGTARRCAACSS